MSYRRLTTKYLAPMAILGACTGSANMAQPPAAGPAASATQQASLAPAAGGASSPAAQPEAGARDGDLTPTAPPALATAQPSAVPPPAVEAAPDAADACSQRRVSYAKPCYDDPDPCGIASGWPGDEYCMLPPAPDEGVQIHFGPNDYKSPAETAKWVIMPTEENNNSVLAHIPLDEERFWFRMRVQMRPGSHHWMGSQVSGKPAEGSYPDQECGGASVVGSLGGGQNLIYDNPPGGVPAPENAGMGTSIAGDSSACINLHAYNFDAEPHLKEIWINLYYIDPAEITQRGNFIGMVGGLGLRVPPGTNQQLSYEGTFNADGRIIQLFGHRHTHTPRFAAWLNDELIYDSWDWMESATFNYDSLTTNPPIDTANKKDGAVSGQVDFKAGDKLRFSCFIENMSDQTLTFKNEARGGEMCNMWGRSIGAGVSGMFL
jgi:hypothetical protein